MSESLLSQFLMKKSLFGWGVVVNKTQDVSLSFRTVAYTFFFFSKGDNCIIPKGVLMTWISDL